MKVWVVVSDCGLNGPWVHAVFVSEPSEDVLRGFELEANGVTGYQWTSCEVFEVCSPVGWRSVCTVTLTVFREDEGMAALVRREGSSMPLELKSIALRGAQREVSAWMLREGYELRGRWENLGYGKWVRKGVRA